MLQSLQRYVTKSATACYKVCDRNGACYKVCDSMLQSLRQKRSMLQSLQQHQKQSKIVKKETYKHIKIEFY